MIRLIHVAFQRTRTVLLLFSFFILWGLYAYSVIPKESTPDVKIPVIYVSLTYDGISPHDSERLLLRPTEQELRSIEGLKEMRSTAFEGGANIVLEFNAGFNVNKARLNVRDKVNIAKINLPKDVKEPVIKEVNLSLFPILIIKLSGEAPERVLYHIAHTLKNSIESSIPAVLQAEIVGNREEVVELLISPIHQEKYGFIFEQVMLNFILNNKIVSAGYNEKQTGKFSIKVPGVFETIDDIMNMPLLVNDDAILKLKDVCSVRKTFKDPITRAYDRVNLKEIKQTVVIEVSKRTGQNLIDTVERIKSVVSASQKRWPSHITVSFAHDESHKIRDMLLDLQNNIISAVILVLAVIIFSLGWRSSLLVGIAVPGSFLMGMMALSLLGYTVNIVVLFSLIFSVGMLVDGAIIVVEYADRRIIDGVNHVDAYKEAAIRMTWPVINSTLTILVVFMPLLFWPGVVGQFMKFMPITLIIVLTASIFMALIFLPVINSILPPPKNIMAHDANDDWLEQLTTQYITYLNKILDRPKRTMGIATLCLICVFTLYKICGRGIEFFPDVEPTSTAIYVHARGNLSIDEQDTLVRSVESKIRDMQEFSSVYTRIGKQSTNGEPIANDVIGIITFEFVDWKKRRKVVDIMKEVETRTTGILNGTPGVRVEVVSQKSGSSSTKPISIEISSHDYTKLGSILARIQAFMEKTSGIIDIENNLPTPGIEWTLTINREIAAQRGVNIATLGQAVKLITTGALLTTYRPNDAHDEVDIVLRFHEKDRGLEQLDSLRIMTNDGAVPISQFITKRPTAKVATINRTDGFPVLTLRAKVATGVLVADKIKELNTWIENETFDPDVHICFKGEDKDQRESMLFLLSAFGIALFMVAVLLVTQFNSFFSVGLILTAVIMSTVGVFVGLMAHNLAFGIVMGGIGIIALAGIIVSNNIILIDTYDILIKEIMHKKGTVSIEDAKIAIIETGRQRLRPVILTKMTTILGLLPIMFGINLDFINGDITIGAPSTEWWILLSTCIIYGVLFASSLTLFFTPSALMWRAQRIYKK